MRAGVKVPVFKRDFRFVGIAAGAHATAGQMTVTDFAANYHESGSAVAAR